MKKIITIILLITILNSCAQINEEQCYNFDNFKKTVLEDLAKAVREDNVDNVRKLLASKKFNIDIKDPIYNQTLLALSIQNKKMNSFIELLKFKADPNILLGDKKETTSFIYAIENQENCNDFFIKNLLKYGANPNLEIINKNKENYFSDKYPLLVAIRNSNDNGGDCILTIKLLIEHGANINCCYNNPMTLICEGVIHECLMNNKLTLLKYFIIEKKIIIPEIVYLEGGINKNSQVKYNLIQILKSEKFLFEDVKLKNRIIDKSAIRNERDEILQYLLKN